MPIMHTDIISSLFPFRSAIDHEQGFYAVYRNLFEKLAQEEAEAVANDRYEESTGAQTYFPSFGCSTTAYDDNSDSDVKQFYNAWLTFSSQKSFSWCDKFRLSEAPDRRVRRAMEKENKKFRDAARKEFNDTVLVSRWIISTFFI